jgi:hypothetical protein
VQKIILIASRKYSMKTSGNGISKNFRGYFVSAPNFRVTTQLTKCKKQRLPQALPPDVRRGSAWRQPLRLRRLM